MQKLVAILLMLAGSSFAIAQDDVSITSSGDYAIDLGQVYGAIQAAKFMGEICSESFPDQSETNAVAFRDWRVRYLPFMQEIELHFSTMAWRESGGDEKRHFQILDEMERSFEGYRGALKSQLKSHGPDAFLDQCKVYRTYLESDRMDLEHFYSEQVAVIRTGPK